jgi:hypothetical protein
MNGCMVCFFSSSSKSTNSLFSLLAARFYYVFSAPVMPLEDRQSSHPYHSSFSFFLFFLFALGGRFTQPAFIAGSPYAIYSKNERVRFYRKPGEQLGGQGATLVSWHTAKGSLA